MRTHPHMLEVRMPITLVRRDARIIHCFSYAVVHAEDVPFAALSRSGAVTHVSPHRFMSLANTGEMSHLWEDGLPTST